MIPQDHHMLKVLQFTRMILHKDNLLINLIIIIKIRTITIIITMTITLTNKIKQWTKEHTIQDQLKMPINPIRIITWEDLLAIRTIDLLYQSCFIYNRHNNFYIKFYIDNKLQIIISMIKHQSFHYQLNMVQLAHIHKYWKSFSAWAEKEGCCRMVEHAVVAIFILYIIHLITKFGFRSRGNTSLKANLTKMGVRISRKFSFVNKKIEANLEAEAAKGFDDLLKDKKIVCQYKSLPKNGMDKDAILGELDRRIAGDIDPTLGKTFAYVYEHSKQHSKLTEQCFDKYMHSNALNPVMFNSLRVLENQVVKMSISLFNGDDNCVGNMTSCGTESLLLAMKTYRDYRGNGDVIMCTTGHPAINKGCNYVGLNAIQIPYDDVTKKMSISHLKKAINSKTILVVCSAPQYPNGVVDDVQEIGKICEKYGVPLHVDSAIGGYVIPFIEKLGRNKFGKWDFRVPAVMSINADIHKYGYSPKGSSVLVYRNSKIRRNQYFTFATWPGGIYISPTALGSRNGGCISSAWGSLLDLGQDGFLKQTQQILNCVDKIVNFVKDHSQLEMMVEPHSTIVSFRCKSLNTYKFVDALKARGYHVEVQCNPDCIHLSIMPQHCKIVDDMLTKMKQAVEQIKWNSDLYEGGTKAIYGTMAKIPDENVVEDFMTYYMDQMYKYSDKK